MTIFDEIRQLVVSPPGEEAAAMMRQKLADAASGTVSTPALTEEVAAFVLDYVTFLFAAEYRAEPEVGSHRKLVLARLGKLRLLIALADRTVDQA